MIKLRIDQGNVDKDNNLYINNRDMSVDYLKAIGIMLVILGHINFANSGIKAWIYSFHMPLFFFSTGLVIKYDNDCSLDAVIKYLKKKANALLIPYLLWGLIYVEFSWQNLGKLAYGSYYTIIHSGSLSSLWFLPVMFISVNMFQLLQFLQNKIKLNRLLYWLLVMFITFVCGRKMPYISIGYPFGFNVALIGLGFIIIGFLTKKFMNAYGHNKILKIVAGSLFFMCTFLYRFNELEDRKYVLMANAEYGKFFIFLFVSYSGCIFIYLLSDWMSTHKVFSKKFSYIGGNTLTILAIHKMMITVFEHFFSNRNINSYIQLGITFLGVLVASCFVCIFINKCIPILGGKRV